MGVAFSPDGTRVMAGDAGITAVKIWDLGPNGDAEWANLPAAGVPAEFMPDGRRVVASSRADGGGGSGTCRRGGSFERSDLYPSIWVSTGSSPVHSTSARTAGRSPPAARRALTAAAARWRGHGTRRPGRSSSRISHRLDVNDVAFSPDGEHLVTAGWDGEAKIVDRSGRVIRVLSEGAGHLFAARFSPDGRLVATAAASAEGRIPLEDLGLGAGRGRPHDQR